MKIEWVAVVCTHMCSQRTHKQRQFEIGAQSVKRNKQQQHIDTSTRLTETIPDAEAVRNASTKWKTTMINMCGKEKFSPLIESHCQWIKGIKKKTTNVIKCKPTCIWTLIISDNCKRLILSSLFSKMFSSSAKIEAKKFFCTKIFVHIVSKPDNLIKKITFIRPFFPQWLSEIFHIFVFVGPRQYFCTASPTAVAMYPTKMTFYYKNCSSIDRKMVPHWNRLTH